MLSPPASQGIIEAVISSSTLPSTGNHVTNVSASDTVPVQRKPKKKRSHTTPTRDRERRELLALRVESVELTKQLQKAREHLATTRKKRQKKLASSSRIVSTVPAWRHIARRHLKARQQAESENRRLREQLEEHLKWSKALQAKLNQRTTSGGYSSPRATATAAALGTVANPLLLAEDEEGITDLELELDDTDRAELVMLSSGLDSAYAQVGSVFKEHSVSEVPLGAVSVFREDGPWLKSADVHPTVHSAWVLWHLGGSCRKSVSAHRSCSYPDVSRQEHTFAVKFRLQTPASKLPPDADPVFLDLKLVLRRYVEQNRLVFVWRGISSGETDLDGLFLEKI
ncbi:hypothetical protein PHPALM_6738, partial [Phytophthora palmivora]